jgi:chemotaxis methyl-accepting protein methylase
LNFAALAGPADLAPPPGLAGRLAVPERRFLSWLFALAGLEVGHYRPETLVRRLPACLRILRAPSVREARSSIEADASQVGTAIGALVIGVTNFFRDSHVFRTLRETVLPELFESKREMRIWSAGCSDGQELYSVTMLLAELGWLNRADLLGTDCRPDAVRRAGDGVYDACETRSVPDDLLRRYFTSAHEPNCWRIDPRLRTVVRWRSGNVLKVLEPGAWDLVLCRNLGMYLEPEVAGNLWAGLHRALGPGRLLVVGKAERPAGQRFAPVAPCVFRRI